MHFALLFPVFLVLVCLPETSTFMDCRPSCQKCRKGNPSSDVLEFYCSMCKECRERNQDMKVRSTEGENKKRTGGTGLSSTEPSHQFAKRLRSPGEQLAIAGGRPRLPMGSRGHLLGPRGRLLRPRQDFLKKHPFGEGDRLGKMGNAALGFERGQNDILDVAAIRAQILSKYVSQPVKIAQLPSTVQHIILTHNEMTSPTTLTTNTIKSMEKFIVKIEQIEKDLHEQRNKDQILHQLQNKLQSNQKQLMQSNEMHRSQQDYVMKSLSGHLENVPSFLPLLEELRPLAIGDQIVYLHEATTAHPSDCPPPPPGCEEVTEKVIWLAVTTTSTITTTTMTTAKPLTPSPCPPIKCQKQESCCPDCPCPKPLFIPPLPPPLPVLPPPQPMPRPPPPPMFPPLPPMLPPLPHMLRPPLPMPQPPPPPMLPLPPPMLPPPPPMPRPPPPPMLPLRLPMLRPPLPPMLPQQTPLILRPPPLILPPPPPMIPRPPLPMLPPQPPPMLPRPPQPMLPLPPLPHIFQLQPPPPSPPPIMAIPVMPQLMVRPPIPMLNPQSMGSGCKYPHAKKSKENNRLKPTVQSKQHDKGGQGFSNVPGTYDIPFDNYIHEEYTGKIRYTEYLRRKSTVTQHFNKDYYYLYVGVPKNNVDHLKNNLLREGVQSNTIPT